MKRAHPRVSLIHGVCSAARAARVSSNHCLQAKQDNVAKLPVKLEIWEQTFIYAAC